MEGRTDRRADRQMVGRMDGRTDTAWRGRKVAEQDLLKDPTGGLFSTSWQRLSTSRNPDVRKFGLFDGEEGKWI